MSANALISEADYFVLAEKASRLLEYIDGSVRPRTDSSSRHATIGSRFCCALAKSLRETLYEPISVGLRIKAGPGLRYYYPDILVFHDDAQFDDLAPDTLLTPIVLAEILADSTRNIDRIEKLDAYLLIPSLQNYLIIDQNRVRIEHFQRSPDGWHFDVYLWRHQEILFNFLDASIPVSEIYRRLDVPEGMILSAETIANSQD